MLIALSERPLPEPALPARALSEHALALAGAGPMAAPVQPDPAAAAPPGGMAFQDRLAALLPAPGDPAAAPAAPEAPPAPDMSAGLMPAAPSVTPALLPPTDARGGPAPTLPPVAPLPPSLPQIRHVPNVGPAPQDATELSADPAEQLPVPPALLPPTDARGGPGPTLPPVAPPQPSHPQSMRVSVAESAPQEEWTSTADPAVQSAPLPEPAALSLPPMLDTLGKAVPVVQPSHPQPRHVPADEPAPQVEGELPADLAVLPDTAAVALPLAPLPDGPTVAASDFDGMRAVDNGATVSRATPGTIAAPPQAWRDKAATRAAAETRADPADVPVPADARPLGSPVATLPSPPEFPFALKGLPSPPDAPVATMPDLPLAVAQTAAPPANDAPPQPGCVGLVPGCAMSPPAVGPEPAASPQMPPAAEPPAASAATVAAAAPPAQAQSLTIEGAAPSDEGRAPGLPEDPAPVAAMPAFVGTLPAPDTAPDLPPLRLTAPDWPAEVTGRIHHAAHAGRETLELDLAPDRLGALRIRLEQQGDETRVTFVTATPEAARLLHAAEPQLGNLLAAAGLTLGGQETLAGQNPGAGGGWTPPPRSARTPLPPRAAAPRTGLVNLIA